MVLTGRGGYGNYVPSPKITAKESPDSPELAAQRSIPYTPAPIQHFTSPSQTFTAGRGGFGNKLPVSKMHTMTPSEYLKEVQDAMDVEPTRYAVGRGGRGNIVDKSKRTQKTSLEKENTLSTVFSVPAFSRRRSNDGSRKSEDSEGLWSKLRTTLSHN